MTVKPNHRKAARRDRSRRSRSRPPGPAAARLGERARAAEQQSRNVGRRIGLAAAFGFVIAAALFATDLTLRQYAGHSLFPFAAPTGGTLLIVSWLALAVAAAWPRSNQ